ncbi:LysR family transcriptional regulator [Xenophilus arseniciresistens]|uniref:LysR family transcriptional regulator n=1 Tax=Xenophilus arseniciresistens TaxID=1283306 RepID=A0AAE3N845_9BURK|nr:LysR family transcriptional regulator [Xenophilus arseniciresistens]MDA7415647.1 LysR family transcriptional regulator [Xenophilus arseniciresistens]
MDRIDNLRIFLRIAHCASFTQAGAQLGIPRASVSLALQQLEARLGVQLLHRTTRRVRLTPDGQALLAHADALVADMDELEQQFRAPQAATGGKLRVDVPSRIARRFIAPALPQFLAAHPMLELELGSSDRRVDLLQEGVDCALRVGALPDSSLVARPLGQFELINCASPAYLARHGTPRSPRELIENGHEEVHYTAPGSTRHAPWEWVLRGKLHSVALPGRAAANNAETYIACALAGLGLIQIPIFDVREHLAAGELVQVMPQACAPPMPVHLLYPHRRHLARRVQRFGDWLQQLLAPHLLQPAHPS